MRGLARGRARHWTSAQSGGGTRSRARGEASTQRRGGDGPEQSAGELETSRAVQRRCGDVQSARRGCAAPARRRRRRQPPSGPVQEYESPRLMSTQCMPPEPAASPKSQRRKRRTHSRGVRGRVRVLDERRSLPLAPVLTAPLRQSTPQRDPHGPPQSLHPAHRLGTTAARWLERASLSSNQPLSRPREWRPRPSRTRSPYTLHRTRTRRHPSSPPARAVTCSGGLALTPTRPPTASRPSSRTTRHSQPRNPQRSVHWTRPCSQVPLTKGEPAQASPKPPCSTCGTHPLRPFVCLACGVPSCGRIVGPSHAHQHAHHTQHKLGPSRPRFFAPRRTSAPQVGDTADAPSRPASTAWDVRSRSLYCFECGEYVRHQVIDRFAAAQQLVQDEGRAEADVNRGTLPCACERRHARS